ncbi:hypothetical protein Rhal01_03742 [Rubritalea halochordaticola]|uniref:Uncharacterized protein n=2 Tax=Rubritalea halochordaticola TaxID=714537 RepID=A0ABP9V4G0_9BACT
MAEKRIIRQDKVCTLTVVESTQLPQKIKVKFTNGHKSPVQVSTDIGLLMSLISGKWEQLSRGPTDFMPVDKFLNRPAPVIVQAGETVVLEVDLSLESIALWQEGDILRFAVFFRPLKTSGDELDFSQPLRYVQSKRFTAEKPAKR